MKKYIFIISLFAVQLEAQTLKQAEKKYENIAYTPSLNAYNKLGEPQTKTALKQMADSYRLNGDYENAEYYYSELVKQEPDKEDIMSYANVLLSNGNCLEAVKWFQKYQEISNDKNRTFISSCDDLKSFPKKNINISPLVAVNSEKSEFSAVPFKGGIVLTATQNDKGTCKDNWTGEGFADLYYADVKDGEASNLKTFGPELNMKYHDGVATFNKAGNIMYFTRTNPSGKNASNQRDLKIFISYFKNGNWSEAVEMPFNSNEFGSCHPTLSNDGKRLYFASNRPGGQGGMDIWVSNLEYGRWSEPKNLGAAVNTSGNEIFPFINEKNTLYFASNGLKGMGGLDIYSTNISDNGFSTPQNVGTPINSPMDDFAYTEKVDATSGFFSSNRKGGIGADDIYFWKNAENQVVAVQNDADKNANKENEKVTKTYKVTVNFFDAQSGNGINKPRITVAGPNLLPNPVVANEMEFEVIPSAQYTIKGELDGYIPHTFTLEGIDLINNPNYKIPLFKNMTKEKNPYEMLNNRPIFNGKSLKTGEVIEIQDIYYDYNKADIRIDASEGLRKLAEVMLRYPTLEVELSSHTDSRGKTDYNQKLSQRRADEAVAYLISRGIAASRMSAKGFGETKLTNKCADNVPCTEEEHQRNRRTEVRVIKFEEEGIEMKKK